MQVFKFGGASIQSSEAVKQLASIVAQQQTPPLVVISAMGKTTQALESIFYNKLAQQPYQNTVEQIYLFHQHIADALLCSSYRQASRELVVWKEQFLNALQRIPSSKTVDRLYSDLVVWGEILASKIIYYYFKEQSLPCIWLDARQYIKTKSGYCNAQIDWKNTQNLVARDFFPLLAQGYLLLTQGFIGSNVAGENTTLGKEGSDFTGAILAASLDAASLTIWKDVPGVMNADPKIFQDATKFDHLSYQEMAKMAFYGAQVIHPQTIQPLAMKNIPLYVKPFQDLQAKGTLVFNSDTCINQPIYILRTEQCLVSLKLTAFAFLDEQCLSLIFEKLARLLIQVNMLERTAYSLALCCNYNLVKVRALSEALQTKFTLHYDAPVSLLTVMQPSAKLPTSLLESKSILLEQRCKELYQVVFKSTKNS